MWKKELEKQREKLQEDLYEGAKAEAKEELQAEGFYMPQLQPIPVGGRVVGSSPDLMGIAPSVNNW